MCELFALSSRVPTAVTLSLQVFAERGGGSTQNIDGWGLAYHDGHDIRLYKEPEPAARSAWLRFVEGQQQRSSTILSHVRRATQGVNTLGNTQPFARELGGRMHVFAHNGRLDGIDVSCAGQWQRFRPLGDTDSEIGF